MLCQCCLPSLRSEVQCVYVCVSVWVCECLWERESECCAATPPFGPPVIPSSPVCVCVCVCVCVWVKERESSLCSSSSTVVTVCTVRTCSSTSWMASQSNSKERSYVCLDDWLIFIERVVSRNWVVCNICCSCLREKRRARTKSC